MAPRRSASSAFHLRSTIQPTPEQGREYLDLLPRPWLRRRTGAGGVSRTSRRAGLEIHHVAGSRYERSACTSNHRAAESERSSGSERARARPPLCTAPRRSSRSRNRAGERHAKTGGFSGPSRSGSCTNNSISDHLAEIATRSETKGPHSAELRSPLADSNRRPPPYHAPQSATGRNPRQRFWLDFAGYRFTAFATGRHLLPPPCSINAPYFVG
jgi:hypothetical protein